MRAPVRERRSTLKTLTRARQRQRDARLPAATIKARAYEHIRRSILDASLPVGSALSEYQLAKEIGASRTPVREALKRLEHEGLVRSVARRGTFVADLSVRDIVEIYQVRTQLEALAARVAAERMERPEAEELLEELNRAEKLARQGRLESARDHDINLHKRIIEATSNGRLAQVLSILDDQVHRIRQRAVMKSTRLPSTLAEHRAILDAILARDPEAADKAMRDHLQAARDNAIELALAGTVF